VNQSPTTQRDPEASARITLRTLELDFSVDIASAKDLHGHALKVWCEAAEDAVFESQMAERRTQRSEG
jgi:hypothetical protein